MSELLIDLAQRIVWFGWDHVGHLKQLRSYVGLPGLSSDFWSHVCLGAGVLPHSIHSFMLTSRTVDSSIHRARNITQVNKVSCVKVGSPIIIIFFLSDTL